MQPSTPIERYRASRTERAAVLLIAVLTGLVSTLVPAPAASAATIRVITFPVEGEVHLTDTFGACRGVACERSHMGQDLMGRKMQRLLAAVDGVVVRADLDRGTAGNMVVLRDAEGWTYHYLHLNNDTPGTDDGSNPKGKVFGPGITAGARVKAGQLVGYMGDSGNAEHTAPHLHFEIRRPDGRAINPYASLVAARGRQFHDVPSGSYFHQPVQWMASNAITTGVGGTNRFEPHRPVTRAEWATFLWRSAGQPRAGSSGFADVPAGSYYDQAVAWMRGRGLTTGVGGTDRFEPHRTLTRAELVTILWRAAGSASVGGERRFADVAAGTFYVAAVAWASHHGITTGVGGSDRFDPHGTVTRAQAATFLHRYAT